MGKGGISNKVYVGYLILIIIMSASAVLGIFRLDDWRNSQTSNELEAKIKSYLEVLARNEWEQAEAYLTGEALLLHQKNTINIQEPHKAVIKDFQVREVQFLNSTEAIIEVRSVIEMTGQQLEENKNRYYLHKSGGWKIYRIEELPESMPKGLEREKIPLLAGITERVIKNITAGEWPLALHDMTGQARREAMRTITTGQQPIITEIKNLEITPISIDNNLAWLRATYNILPSQINPAGGKITLNIRLKNLVGHWMVYRTEIIKLGEL